MSDVKPPYLADQHFTLSPDHPEDSEDGVTPIDLEIIAATYRSIVDQDAFEEMIANWEAKLNPVRSASDRQPQISKQMFGHLMMARKTLERLDIPAENDPLRRAISDIPGPAIVLSPDGRVAIANIEGERAFDTRQGAFLDEAIIAAASRQDFAALKRAANDRGNAAQAILTICPPDDGIYSDPFIAEGYLLNMPGQSSAHIAIRSLEMTWSASGSERLQQAFGLSAAEAEVARQFFQQRNIDRIAEARGVSRLTVRTQIKSIMTKTGSPSNVDLMRLLAMVASRELLGQSGQTPVWHDPLQREERIELPDGRVIAWTWMGAEDGVPVAFMRGLPMTYLLPGNGEARLREAGIKLCVLSRPGYGNSTADLGLSVLDDNLIALRAFHDEVIGQPCLGVGLASGIAPLLVEQNANPGRFHRLLVVGFAAGFDQSGIHRLPTIQRTMLRLAISAPWVVELMAKTGHRMMRQHGLDWYLQRAFQHTPLNQKTLANPDWTALIRNACEHALKQGHASFVRELQLVRQNIDAAIRGVTIPVHYLAPTEDAAIDLVKIRTWERINPNIAVEAVYDAAELVFYQQPDLILDRIIAMARTS